MCIIVQCFQAFEIQHTSKLFFSSSDTATVGL